MPYFQGAIRAIVREELEKNKPAKDLVDEILSLRRENRELLENNRRLALENLKLARVREAWERITGFPFGEEPVMGPSPIRELYAAWSADKELEAKSLVYHGRTYSVGVDLAAPGKDKTVVMEAPDHRDPVQVAKECADRLRAAHVLEGDKPCPCQAASDIPSSVDADGKSYRDRPGLL